MPSSILFSEVSPDKVLDQVIEALNVYQDGIDRLANSKKDCTFDQLMFPLEKLSSDFEKFWSSISHLNDVKSTDELNEAVEAAKKLISQFSTQMYQNEPLYKAIKNLQGHQDLTPEQNRLVEQYLIEFKLSGVHLDAEMKKELIIVRKQLTEAKGKFKENKSNATSAWTKIITDEKDLDGLPDNIVAQAALKAQKEGLKGWLLTLAPGTVTAVLSHATSRELRSEFHFAYYTAASDWGPYANLYDNAPFISQIHLLRQKEAQILGFRDHVDVSLAQKMANREQVIKLQSELSVACRQQAQEEYNALEDFAIKVLGLDEMRPFDVGFVSTQLKKAEYNLDEKLISEYFPEGQVLKGMFEVVNRLFGITLKEEQGFDKWDEDVKLFSIYSEQDKKLGEIYMDLYARPDEKRGGAWMNQCQSRITEDGTTQLPIAFLSTNFSKGDGSKPSLLTHREVQTTFHEFGHCLHHVLSTANYPSLAGPAGVPWDAVETPSQMMENWVWQKEGLQLFSSHYETGKPLPDHLINALEKNRHYNSAMNALQQLCYGTFDFNLYTKTDKQTPEQIQKHWLDTYRQIQVSPIDDYNHMPNTFAHIFSGGYSAGYYAYKWALNMAHDMFSEFEKNGLFDKATGRHYLKTILEPGGTKPFMELLTDFLGREPRNDALFNAICKTSKAPSSPLLVNFNRIKGKEEMEDLEYSEEISNEESKTKSNASKAYQP